MAAARQVPSRGQSLFLPVKLAGLRAKRGLANLRRPIQRLGRSEPLPHLLAEVCTPLYSEPEGRSESILELGKVQNLRISTACLNGVTAQSGQVFSFWRQVGRCTRARGFRLGRQVQTGCLIPAIGGGICQLTNSLYEAAQQAGLEIVERHSHTVVIPGSPAERDLDATVAWNYVDLRWKGEKAWQISAHLSASELVVQIRGEQPKPKLLTLGQKPSRASIDPIAHSCATCGEDSCHIKHRLPEARIGSTAVLVDEFWPEFDAYLSQLDHPKDLFAPLDSDRWRRPQYRWSKTGYRETHFATRTTLTRAWKQRKLAGQGAARQQSLLEGSTELAAAYAATVPTEATHLVVAQTLLPFLWQSGALGGRTFDVLMSRLPLDEIHHRLDAAHQAHPERALLSDFRANDKLVNAEREALAAARHIVTPHTDVAALLKNSLLIPWSSGKRLPWQAGRAIAFPGPTAARKGAFEVREAARLLELEVVLLGSELEGDSFWDGVKTRRATSADWLNGVGVVVQPAVIEDRPRNLLQALASGCPVVATVACGLQPHPLLTIIEEVDSDELISAIRSLCN